MEGGLLQLDEERGQSREEKKKERRKLEGA